MKGSNFYVCFCNCTVPPWPAGPGISRDWGISLTLPGTGSHSALHKCLLNKQELIWERIHIVRTEYFKQIINNNTKSTNQHTNGLILPPKFHARDAYHLPGEDSVGSRFEHPKSSGTLAVSEGAPPGPRIARPVPQEGLSRLRDSHPGSPAPVPAAPPVTCLPRPSRCRGARHGCTGLVFQGEHPTGPHRGQDTHSELRGTRTKGNLLFGDQREVQADKSVWRQGNLAGRVLTEEGGQAVPHSGPPRDGAPDPLTALCILYVSHSTCEHKGIPLGTPSQETYFPFTFHFTSMQSTSCELQGWMNLKLQSRL